MAHTGNLGSCTSIWCHAPGEATQAQSLLFRYGTGDIKARTSLPLLQAPRTGNQATLQCWPSSLSCPDGGTQDPPLCRSLCTLHPTPPASQPRVCAGIRLGIPCAYLSGIGSFRFLRSRRNDGPSGCSWGSHRVLTPALPGHSRAHYHCAMATISAAVNRLARQGAQSLSSHRVTRCCCSVDATLPQDKVEVKRYLRLLTLLGE
jgi:hypothetical protein